MDCNITFSTKTQLYTAKWTLNGVKYEATSDSQVKLSNELMEFYTDVAVVFEQDETPACGDGYNTIE